MRAKAMASLLRLISACLEAKDPVSELRKCADALDGGRKK